MGWKDAWVPTALGGLFGGWVGLGSLLLGRSLVEALILGGLVMAVVAAYAGVSMVRTARKMG